MPFSDMLDGINKIAAEMCQTSNEWIKISAAISEIVEMRKEIDEYIKHIHRSHLHQWNDVTSHTYENISKSKAGESSNCFGLNPVDLLLTELYSEEDVDNNGLIYGIDFIISNYDIEKPRALIHAEQQLETMHNIYFPSRVLQIMDFHSYLDSVYYEQRKLPLTLEGKLIQEIITGVKFIKNDQYIYGYDYIVSDDDNDKPTVLKEIENQYLSIKPEKQITWSDMLTRYGYKQKTSITTTTNKKIIDCNYPSTRLLGEWLHSIDIDGNGLIYGTDFILASNDEYKPQCLYDIEMDVQWAPPENIKIFNWEEFCATFPNNNPDDRGDMSDD